MSFVRRSPENVTQLEDSLKQLHENREYISSVKANESSSHLEVDLNWKANSFGGEAGKDFYLKIKRGKLSAAKELADKLMKSTYAPSRNDAQSLFDMLEPGGN